MAEFSCEVDPMDCQTLPFVSVIIPVFNDAERLSICLRALQGQTYPQQSYEIIVVDNASQEAIKPIALSVPRAIYCYESRPGSYIARNTGIGIAKGNLFAFTDSDCIPDADWIEKGVQAFLNTPNCGLVAGHINLFFQDKQRPTAVELYDSIKIGFPQDRFIEDSQYGATANLFTSRSVFDAVGLFNETLKSSGDREWGQRVFKAGYRQQYSPDAKISHPARRTWRELHKKVVRITGGHIDFKREQGVSSLRLTTESLKETVKDFLPPLRMYYYIWSYPNLVTTYQRLQFLMALLFVRYVRGWERLRLIFGGVSSRG